MWKVEDRNNPVHRAVVAEFNGAGELTHKRVEHGSLGREEERLHRPGDVGEVEATQQIKPEGVHEDREVVEAAHAGLQDRDQGLRVDAFKAERRDEELNQVRLVAPVVRFVSSEEANDLILGARELTHDRGHAARVGPGGNRLSRQVAPEIKHSEQIADCGRIGALHVGDFGDEIHIQVERNRTALLQDLPTGMVLRQPSASSVSKGI